MRAPGSPRSLWPSPRARGTRHSTGFSFVEVLFAVMILGVGFIMLAAIFPVAIQQAHTASDESVSAAVAWNALSLIESKISDADLPAVGAPAPYWKSLYPGVVRSFRDPQAWSVATLRQGQFNGRYTDPRGNTGNPITYAQPKDYLWNRIKGESVVVDDRRFAWVAFYRRQVADMYSGDAAPYAQVVVVVARSRETAAYSTRDVSSAVLANLQPRRVKFDLTSDGAGPVVDQVVTFTEGETGAVAEGAYLVVAHDKLPAPSSSRYGPQGAMNCYVFRIGNRVSDNTWELSPETEFVAPTVVGTPVEGLSGAEGYVIGRTAAGGRYEGVAQDVGVYTMIIPVQ